jgi:hypothetical protein
VENRRDVILADKTITPFSFESEISKLKVSLPFNEIFINDEYINQLLKMIKNEKKSILSYVVNLQDDSPTIVFGRRMDNATDDDVPSFHVTLKKFMVYSYIIPCLILGLHTL